jgi:3-hydroxyacyl-CoA dehydrogenase
VELPAAIPSPQLRAQAAIAAAAQPLTRLPLAEVVAEATTAEEAVVAVVAAVAHTAAEAAVTANV